VVSFCFVRGLKKKTEKAEKTIEVLAFPNRPLKKSLDASKPDLPKTGKNHFHLINRLPIRLN